MVVSGESKVVEVWDISNTRSPVLQCQFQCRSAVHSIGVKFDRRRNGFAAIGTLHDTQLWSIESEVAFLIIDGHCKECSC